MKNSSLVLLAVALLFGLTSCGVATFNKEWKAAVKAPGKPQCIAGAWEGNWLSGVNAHTGKLRAIVGDPKPNGDRDVKYYATWGWLFRGTFSAVHHTHGSEGFTTFTADKPIGRHGDFHAEGMISCDRFAARYKAPGDAGSFELKRPAGP